MDFILKKFFKYSCTPNPSRKTLAQRSKETFARIGSFYLHGKEYQVVALHLFEASRVEHNELVRTFGPINDTTIGICESSKVPSHQLFCGPSRSQSFEVTLGRDEAHHDNVEEMPSSEPSVIMLPRHYPQVLGHKRHLVVGNIMYNESTDKEKRAPEIAKVLDQKLPQLMFEIAQQNRDILTLWSYDDHAALRDAGFKMSKGNY